ncbi:hypothetical protein PFISCL1PPCAC_4653, partial [Pristionchus fissidentatus]
QSATVLRNVRIEPGELGAVWVTGSEDASVVLDTVVDQVIEGVAVKEKFVIVPVYNDTKEEMKFEKHQSIGSWKLVDGSVNGVSSEGGEESPRCRRVEAQGEDEWEAIMEKLIKNRGEAIGRELKGDKELRNKEEVAVEKSEGKEKWKKMQEEKEWVVELVRKWREVENGKGEKTEIVKIPDSTKKYSMADVIVEEGILYLIGRDHERRLYVPRRERLKLVKEIHESVLVGHVGVQKLLELVEKEYVWGSMNKDVAKVVRECEVCIERERMKTEYDRRKEGNKGNEPRVGDRVYVFRERSGEKNPKIRIWIVVDRGSPMHWSHVCPECRRNPRKAGDLWKGCPEELKEVEIRRMLELAVLIRSAATNEGRMSAAHARIVLDRKLTDRRIGKEECRVAIENTCVHAKRTIEGGGNFRFDVQDVKEELKEVYRMALGEKTGTSTGYGAVLYQKALKNMPGGRSDASHWEWYTEVTTDWIELLRELSGRKEKRVKIVTIFWPRGEERSRRQEIWRCLKDVTERCAWRALVLREPCGQDTESDYESQMLEMAGEATERGEIRVIYNDSAFVQGGLPTSSLHITHPHLQRIDWEKAMELWQQGKRWIPPSIEVRANRRPSYEWETPRKGISRPMTREEMEKKKEEKMKGTICHNCHKPGHYMRDCTEPAYSPTHPHFDRDTVRRGRLAREEEDVEQ